MIMGIEYKEHIDICGARTEFCNYCQKPIKIKGYYNFFQLIIK